MSESPKYDPIDQIIEYSTPPNRAKEIRFESGDASQIKVTLIQIDETIINYLSNTINPTVVDNERPIPVPVLYATPERWKNIRKDGYMRDPKSKKIQTPLITIRRAGIARGQLANPSNKYLYITHQAQWNARNAYDRFAVLNNVRPSLEQRNVIVPDYVDLNYEIIIWTEYVEQMNHIIEQINVENEEFWGLRNQYKFRVKIEEFVDGADLPPTTERIVRNSFTMKVSAYLIPERYIKDFAAKTTNAKQFTVKKIITITEIDGTGENSG